MDTTPPARTPRTGARKPRAAYHHGDLRNALVERALAHLGRAGPEELSVRALAAQIGVSPSAAYRHFQDREALLAELARGGFARLADAMDRAAKTGGDAPAGRLTAIGMSYIRFAIRHPQLYRLMFGAQRVEKSRHPDLGAEAKRAYDTLAQTVRALPALPGGTTEQAHHARTLRCWALVHGLASLRIDALIADMPHAAFEALAQSALSGVAQ